MRIFHPLPLVGVVLLAMVPAAAKTCTPEQFGARHDGVSLDTVSLQKAIDACGAADRIVLRQGIYVSGPLTLESGDTLVVEKGAVLQASADHTLFLPSDGKPKPLIGAQDAHDITLTGEGVIDGNGKTWWGDVKAARAAGLDYPRPRLILLTNVSRLTVSKLTLQNSPTFHLVPEHANDVLVEYVTIRVTESPPEDAPNTDGIDPSGRNMTFRNLTIDVGDDNIAIKSGQADVAHPTEATANIAIRDCVFLHGHGLSIGSETNGGVANVLAENIAFDGTDNGIRIKTGRDRGGPVRHLIYRNLTMKNVGNAILVTDYYPKIPEADAPRPVGPTTPRISDVRFEHVRIENAAFAGLFFGLPEQPLENIVLSDVVAKARHDMVARHALVRIKGSKVTAPSAFVEQENGKFLVEP